MSRTAPGEITALLRVWAEGSPTGLNDVIALAYRHLHELAKRYLAREPPGQTLQTTALVNEAYVRLLEAERISCENRSHFFGVAAQMMRRILVDHARSRRYLKRGGDALKVSLCDVNVAAPSPGADVLALNEALDALAEYDHRKARVVELRYFAGLTAEETAAVLNISAETVLRDWRLAKSWLLRHMTDDVRGT